MKQDIILTLMGKLVRYVDENGKIHENDSEMTEADKKLKEYKPSFLGNRL